MDSEILKNIVEKLYFSREAAYYLGISTQRLNQLVHAKEIQPVKQSAAGMLFYKDDLDARIKQVKEIASKVGTNQKKSGSELRSKHVQKAVNYFVMQSFYNYSDKKTEPIFLKAKKQIDLELPMVEIAEALIPFIDQPVTTAELLDKEQKIYRAFESLEKEDLIVSKDMEEYPDLLKMTKEAPPYLFMRGNVELLKENIVSVVGSRNASEDGRKKATILAKKLGEAGIVVASGLARGIDAAAHSSALNYGYKTIAVIGTPLTRVYPKENADLQKEISKYGLVISQFPPSADVQRWFFPMRNAVMSGISLATAIMEAGETSGALKQADYALKQNRLVFIPQSALNNDKITWPRKYIQRKGAMQFSRVDDLFEKLETANVVENVHVTSIDEQISVFSEDFDTGYVYNTK